MPNQLTLSLLALCLTLSGCSGGSAPDESWEIAVKGIYSAAISPDGRYTAIGSVHHGGSLWEINSHKRLYNWNHNKDEFSTLVATAFSPEGQYAVSATPQTIVLWDSKTGASLTFWTTPGNVLDIDLGPNGNYALLGLAGHSAVIFDVKRGGITSTFYHSNRVRSVGLSADGSLAISGSEDQTAAVWNTKTGELVQRISLAADVQLVALSGDGKTAFSVSKYDRAVLWNTVSGEIINDLPVRDFAIEKGYTFTAAVLSMDGSELLTGSTSGIVNLWKTENQAILKTWSLPVRDYWRPTAATVIAVSFAKNNTYYAVSSNGFIHQLSR